MADESGFQLSGSAPERYEQFVAPIMAPFVAALLDAARLTPGASVLDVACGTGFATRSAASRVGATGRVVGVDINAGMIQMAAVTCAHVQPPVELHEAPADRLPVGDGEFDAVVCQQGLQFFPDRRAAVDEMARAARPSGRVAITVWAPMDQSPYLRAQYGALESIVGRERSASLVAAFACSGDDAATTFRAAGLRDVDVRQVRADVRLADIETYMAGHLSALPWGAVLQEARPDGIDAAVASMLQSLGDQVAADGSLTVPFASLLVTGTA
jgi:SAM-dependent methyltransferase